MRDMLDPEAMRPVLQRSFEPGTVLGGVKVRYVRYKPVSGLIVHYETDVGGERYDAVARVVARGSLVRKVREPRNARLARMARDHCPKVIPLSYEAGLEAMIQWLPLDISLPALAEPATVLRQRLAGAGIEPSKDPEPPRLLAYKPRRRAVLRLGEHILKAYARKEDFRAASGALHKMWQARAMPVAGFEAAFPDLGLTVQTTLDCPSAGDAAVVADEAGTVLDALRRLPVAGLAQVPPARQLAAAAGSAALVGVIAPALRRRVERLASRLAATVPTSLSDGLVASHGDFYAGQLLRRDGEIAVIDFDELCAAPPALDLATYAAHLVRGQDSDLAAAQTALEAVAEGYGERPDGLDWYFAASILRRAQSPFRYLVEEWPVRVESMVVAAEKALSP